MTREADAGVLTSAAEACRLGFGALASGAGNFPVVSQ
jgi:hypothetical protein